jgi:hypothetical protein
LRRQLKGFFSSILTIPRKDRLSTRGMKLLDSVANTNVILLSVIFPLVSVIDHSAHFSLVTDMNFMAPRRLLSQDLATNGVKSFGYLFQDVNARSGALGGEVDVFI